MARVCYLRRLRRRQAFKRTMQLLCEIPLPPDALRIALEHQLAAASLHQPWPSLEVRRSVRALLTLLTALDDGRLGIYQTAVGRAVARPEKNAPARPVDNSPR